MFWISWFGTRSRGKAQTWTPDKHVKTSQLFEFGITKAVVVLVYHQVETNRCLVYCMDTKTTLRNYGVRWTLKSGWGAESEKESDHNYYNQKKSIFPPKSGGGRPPALQHRTPWKKQVGRISKTGPLFAKLLSIQKYTYANLTANIIINLNYIILS